MPRFSKLFGIACLIIMFGYSIHAQSDLQAELQTFLVQIGREDGPAIAANITTSGGTRSVEAAIGRIDIQKDTPASPSDRFRIASMSKIFLAVTLLMLQEDGVLSLDDYLYEWLDEQMIAALPNADTVTLYDLVTMRSGIPDYLGDDFFEAISANPLRVWTPEEAVAFAYGSEAEFDPNDGYSYSNTNYVLLQLVVEAATQQSLAKVFRQRIFVPLDMANTYTQIAELLDGGFVHGYEDLDGDGIDEDVTDINDGAGLGDGGLVSTTADLVRFYKALLIDKTLLQPESLQAMLQPTDDENGYGMGIEIYGDEQVGMVYGHTGSVLGFSGAVFYAQTLDILVVIFYANQGLAEEHITQLFTLASP